MEIIKIGTIVKIDGSSIKCLVSNSQSLSRISTANFGLSHLSIGALVGTRLVDGRILILAIEEIYKQETDLFFNAIISGIYDEILNSYSFGTNSYPIIGETIFKIDKSVLKYVFDPTNKKIQKSFIGTYYYNQNIKISYNPNVLFGKHLGVFGNTGSGKTCTVVSLIQNYIRSNPKKDIKFIVLDVNGEYENAFESKEAEYYPFESLRFRHHILDLSEYGRLFRASEGIQYPALKDVISNLGESNSDWKLSDLPNSLRNWINNNTPLARNGNERDAFTANQLNGYLRTMLLRIDDILRNKELISIVDNPSDKETFDSIMESNKKVQIIDLQTSTDSLDIVLYLLFKKVYLNKTLKNRKRTHVCLVLEEAHRYINIDVQETKLGGYYIDKLAREGRKFGIGLIVSSQIPSMLSYEIVSQCNSVIMHKITNKKDLDYLKGVLRISGETFFLQMSSLEKQYAIVCGEAFNNDTIVRINNANPLPLSKDPEIVDND